MDTLLQDIRLSLRRLRKAPLFAAVAVISIGLGIGANTAVFSLLDQALLRSLPVKDPGRLVLLNANGPRSGWMNANYDGDVTFSYPVYRDFRDSKQFDGVLARAPITLAVAWHGQTDRVPAEIVSGNYFDVLGAQAAIGRTLLPEDDRTPGAHPVAVLDYGYWKSRFGGDPTVLNQTFQLNAHTMTIVGVMPKAFHGVGTTERPFVYVPMMMRAEMYAGRQDLEDRKSYWLSIFGRLKPGVSVAQTQTAVLTWWRPHLEEDLKLYPTWRATTRDRFLNQKVKLVDASSGISGAPDNLAGGLAILAGMVALLLLIACANVASLMIARATARQKEIAIYLALGASRWRLFRQVMVESVVISLTGGAFGVLLAYWMGDFILGILPEGPQSQGITSQPDARILLFTLGVSILSGLLFGLAPAFQTTRLNLSSMLKEQASNVMGARSHVRLRKGLVVAQVALSLVLLIAAGLFTYGLRNIEKIPVGFRTDHLLSFSVQPRLNGYKDEKLRAFYTQLRDNLEAIPGIQGVAAANVTLLSGDNSQSSIDVPGYTRSEGENMSPNENWVTAGYFGVMGLPLLNGREFRPQDNTTSPRVAVVNETFAKRFFSAVPGGNVLGRRFSLSSGKVTIEIVGMVRDTKTTDLREDKPQAVMYFPVLQDVTDSMTYYVRTNRDVPSMTAELRSHVSALDPDLPVFDIKTMTRQIDESLFVERLVSALSTAFGILATLLAAVGLYGVMAYLVVRRTREIGIRMALGATPGQVQNLVMREVVLLAGIGMILALLSWFPVGGVIQNQMGSQLMNITGWNPLVVSSASVMLAAVAFLAGFLPARRATRIQPVSALRYE
jgi:predicted permease